MPTFVKNKNKKDSNNGEAKAATFERIGDFILAPFEVEFPIVNKVILPNLPEENLFHLEYNSWNHELIFTVVLKGKSDGDVYVLTLSSRLGSRRQTIRKAVSSNERIEVFTRRVTSQYDRLEMIIEVQKNNSFYRIEIFGIYKENVDYDSFNSDGFTLFLRK